MVKELPLANVRKLTATGVHCGMPRQSAAIGRRVAFNYYLIIFFFFYFEGRATAFQPNAAV